MMPHYFFDSSAIIKRYVEETGSGWVRSLCDPAAGNRLDLVTITRVEVSSALSRRCREGTVTAEDRDRLLGQFLYDCTRQYRLVDCTLLLLDLAAELCKRHPLRASLRYEGYEQVPQLEGAAEAKKKALFA